jgi:hypothetical protein
MELSLSCGMVPLFLIVIITLPASSPAFMLMVLPASP